MKERPIIFTGPMVRAILDGKKTEMRWVVMNPRGSCVDVHELAEWAERYVNATGATDCWSFKRRVGDKPSRESWNVMAVDTIRCPHGVPGDRLWVRETWAAHPLEGEDPPTRIMYRADGSNWWVWHDEPKERGRVEDDYPDWTPKKWKSSIHMNREYSRIDLEVTDVRVERAQDISDEDARAEGCEGWECGARVSGQDVGPIDWETPREEFGKLWDSINAKPRKIKTDMGIIDGPGYGWDKNPWVWAIEFKPLASPREEAE